MENDSVNLVELHALRIAVGRNIRTVRRMLNLSVNECAWASGLNAALIHAYEKGETTLESHVLQELASIFGVEIGDLLAIPKEEVVF